MVTYNRRELLTECLNALAAQTHPVSQIAVVDNVSTDGTVEMLQRDFPAIHLIRLQENSGGAGGFHVGLRWAREQRAEWIWLMDDDSIPAPTALEQLFAARERFDPEQRPLLLASKVEWTDGSIHYMNSPFPHSADLERLVLAAGKGTLALRAATFVSCLLHRSLVERYALPVADYFIWGDDTEYTARILRENFGVLVPASVVLHKTATKHTALDAPPERYYFHLRNTLWMLTRSDAFVGKERLRYFVTWGAWIWRYLRVQRFSGASLRAVLIGVRDGLFRAPRGAEIPYQVEGARTPAPAAESHKREAVAQP